MVIRELAPNDSLEALTELLHRAYKQLADMGLRYLATHQDVATTQRRISRGTCFVAEIDGRIVGTITFNPPGIAKGSPYIEKAGVGHLQQMGVEPGLQRQGIAKALMTHAENYARLNGVAEISIDTAETATHLISWYERIGYEFKEHIQWDVTNYRSVVMGKKL
ncbi:MAG: GNAT family N-acetyltransferase [bacterium]|nr:GNAT family N-acetyltransferase [bacterium]